MRGTTRSAIALSSMNRFMIIDLVTRSTTDKRTRCTRSRSRHVPSLTDMQPAPRSSEGHMWTPDRGVQRGLLRSKGVVEPPTSINRPSDTIYDAIVIGSGYAGLMAARDLAQSSTSRDIRLRISVDDFRRSHLTSGSSRSCGWPDLDCRV